MKTVKLSKKNISFLTIDNMVGLVLAILIVFDLKVENDLKEVINSPIGIIISFVLLIITFIFMNPIVGLLFLIYLYECVKDTTMNPRIFSNNKNLKQKIMKKLNNNVSQRKSDKVEHDVIRNMAPIVTKRENSNALFIPHINDTIPFEKL